MSRSAAAAEHGVRRAHSMLEGFSGRWDDYRHAAPPISGAGTLEFH